MNLLEILTYPIVVVLAALLIVVVTLVKARRRRKAEKARQASFLSAAGLPSRRRGDLARGGYVESATIGLMPGEIGCSYPRAFVGGTSDGSSLSGSSSSSSSGGFDGGC
jgi:hypothetical protein